MSERRYTCKDCKYYRPIDEERGDRFGHVVPANMPVKNCPAKAFEPRE
ncbi:MAG: hypothetical protein QI223_09590 [Candidatus Korarchaeota archaeon]|nr:hypothetical protein [Candidatus Korarchaeota archaeon]